MGINPDALNLIIEQAIQKALQTNQNTTNYYKNMNEPKQSSKCSTVITTKNYKKDRTVCKNCCNSNTPNLMKKKFGLLEESRSNNQYIQDSSNKEDNSNKQVRSRKQVGSNKKDCSSNQNSSVNIKNIDPDCLMENFSELHNSKDVSIEQSQDAREQAKESLNELLGVKTKMKHNVFFL